MTHIVILSGGLDSTVLATTVSTRHATGATTAVSFNYGQRHVRELDAASAVCHYLDIPHHVIDLSGLLGRSALTGDGEVPHGSYTDPSMAATVVPGRNLLFIAATVARARAGDTIHIGVHAGDHPIYADCRPEFVAGVARAVDVYGVTLEAPYLHKSKSHIVAIGVAAGAPLGLSWSCYEGGDVHCGRCGTCVERAEAFHLAGVSDPTEYADPTFWAEALR